MLCTAACVDGCVDVLLDELDEMIEAVTSVDVTGIIPAPWPSLREVRSVPHSIAMTAGYSSVLN